MSAATVATKDVLALNSLLTDKVRLAIVVTLAAADEAPDFNTLLERLDLSKGNLSSHVRKLEEGGLVQVHKEFLDRKPRTTYSVTTKGRQELKSYLETVEALLSAAA